MIIHTIPSGPLATNAYVVVCPSTKLAAVIDPAPESAQKILSYLTKNQLQLDKILLTHSHWDHIADTAALKSNFPSVPVLIHPEDAPNLEAPGSDKLPGMFTIEGVHPDVLFCDKDVIQIGTLSFEVIHTPGHTPGGVCFYCKQHHVLISGDTLFRGTMGTLSLPTARPKLMWSSLKKLAQLPKDTVVYPGHGPSTTIGAEHWLAEAESLFG